GVDRDLRSDRRHRERHRSQRQTGQFQRGQAAHRLRHLEEGPADDPRHAPDSGAERHRAAGAPDGSDQAQAQGRAQGSLSPLRRLRARVPPDLRTVNPHTRPALIAPKPEKPVAARPHRGWTNCRKLRYERRKPELCRPESVSPAQPDKAVRCIPNRCWSVRKEEVMRGIFWRRCFPAVLFASALAAGGGAAEKAPFYQGKTLNFIINFGAGGPTDIEARIVAKHLGRDIPGNPTITVQNMGGGGGLTAVNYIGEVAKPDGFTAAYFTGSLFQHQIKDPALRVDIGKFGFITGVHGVTVSYIRSDVAPGIKKPSDFVKAQRFRAAGLGVSSSKDV